MATRRKRLFVIYGLTLGAILLFTLFPFAATIASVVTAEATGCSLDQATPYPCIVGGVNYGYMVAVLFMLGGAWLFTVPIGVFALGTWLVILILHCALRARKIR